MLNVKATPCEKSKAIVLVGKGHFGFSNKFADDLEEAKPDAFDLFFELIKGAAGLHLLSMYSYRKSNKMVYEVPTYFEE